MHKIFESIYNVIASKIFFISYFTLAGILIISLAISSLSWNVGLDNQPLLYLAYLTTKFHLLPYRDFFYYQMPGVHLYYIVISLIFGFSILSIRIADLFFLTVTLTTSYFLFKKISIKTALCGSALFALYYLLTIL